MEYREFTIKIPRLRWRYFSFSLQSLLLLIVSVALGFGWWRDHHRLKQEITRLQHRDSDWETDQVLGLPDTPGAGDIRTAWASQTADGQKEWLLVEYDRAVRPNAVLVHETYNPGAVSKVTAFKSDREETVLWTGTDPTPRTSNRGISTIPVNVAFETRRVKIYIDSPAVPGWNEIDAVGVQYGSGKILWATRAYASSSYGENNELPQPFTIGGITLSR